MLNEIFSNELEAIKNEIMSNCSSIFDEQRREIERLRNEITILKEFKDRFPNPNQGYPGQMIVLNQDKATFRFETIPNSISFCIYLSKNTYPIDRPNWKIIPFDSVLYDSAKSFDVKSHCYSIPIKGKWKFTGKVFFHNDEKRNLLSLRFTKNDKCVTEISKYHDKEEQNWEAISDEFECECEVKDKIQLQTYHYKNLKSGEGGTYLQGRYLGPI